MIIINRNLCFLREITWVCNCRDKSYFPEFVLGKNMLGIAQHVPTMTSRVTPATRDVPSLTTDISAHNRAMLERIKPNDDMELESASWQKTLNDLKMPALKGPYYDLAEVHPQARQLQDFKY